MPPGCVCGGGDGEGREEGVKVVSLIYSSCHTFGWDD